MQQYESQIIRFPALKKKLGNISRSTIDRWEASKSFPKRIRLGKNSVGWDLQRVETWIQERLQSEQEDVHA